MKNKFALIALSISLLASSAAFAKKERDENKFTKHKAEVIANLNKERSAIDSEISCLNSATQKKEARKCRKQRRAVLDKLRQERVAKRKAHRQEKLKKLDEKSNKTKQKTNRK